MDGSIFTWSDCIPPSRKSLPLLSAAQVLIASAFPFSQVIVYISLHPQQRSKDVVLCTQITLRLCTALSQRLKVSRRGGNHQNGIASDVPRYTFSMGAAKQALPAFRLQGHMIRPTGQQMTAASMKKINPNVGPTNLQRQGLSCVPT